MARGPESRRGRNGDRRPVFRRRASPGFASRSKTGRRLPSSAALRSINNEGNAIRGLGDVAAARGSTSRAQGLWRAALRFYERFDDAFNIGTIHVRLARASTGQARLDEASRAEQAWVRVGRDDLVANYLAPLKQRPQASGTTFKQGPF